MGGKREDEAGTVVLLAVMHVCPVAGGRSWQAYVLGAHNAPAVQQGNECSMRQISADVEETQVLRNIWPAILSVPIAMAGCRRNEKGCYHSSAALT